MAAKSTAQKRKSASSEASSKKKPKTSKSTPTPTPVASVAAKTTKAKPKQRKAAAEKLVLAASDSGEEEDDDRPEDQTAALLRGFESTSSASDSEDNDNDDDAAAAKPLDLALLPDPAITTSSTQNPKHPTDPTVIYISRIPHGFHESQMSQYFTQFGPLTHLRLARNRRTGRSKHYAFLNFADADVAAIVARTMDNYLLFGHVLKCRVLGWDDVARLGGVDAIFKGSGKRWKRVPWNAIERNRLQRADREGWGKRVKGEERRRSAKAAKLRELGYVFEVPALRAVEDVPVKTTPAAPAVEAADGQKALESGKGDGLVAQVEDAAVSGEFDGTNTSRGVAEKMAAGSSEKSSKKQKKKKERKA